MMKNWKDENGEAYIDVFIKLSIAMTLIFIIITIPGPVIDYMKLSYMCRSVTRAIENTGGIDDVSGLLNDLKAATSLNPTISYTGFRYIEGKLRVNLRDKFTVTMETTHSIKLFEWSLSKPLEFTIPLKVTSHGMGEVYFKN